MATIIAALLLLASLAGVTLERAYFYVPLKELRYRAEHGDHISAALVLVTAYGGEARLLLAGLAVATSAGGLVWLASLVPWAVSSMVAIIFIGGAFFWLPRTRLHASEARVAAWCAPALGWLLTRSRPLTQPLVDVVRKAYKRRTHTGLFELADLVELFEHQMHQRDNRISPTDLARVQSMLGAGKRKVQDGMTPAKSALAINGKDGISPVLIDELHRSGRTYFPVYEQHQGNIVGTLSMERIADVHQRGTIADSIDRHLAYVHEDDSLAQALRAFFETHQQLFIVVNSSGKYVGVISLSDILRQVIGGLDSEAFGQHDDREAVAGRHPSKKSPSKKDETVVE